MSCPSLATSRGLALDAVVNAVWLALYRAKTEKNEKAESALNKLILEWPLDFVWINGDTPEAVTENMFIWSVNFAAKAERLRNFVGLENTNLMRIVATAFDFVNTKLAGNNKPGAAAVRKWLVENVHWGVFDCPDVTTVTRHMTHRAAISRQKVVGQLMEAAAQRWD